MPILIELCASFIDSFVCIFFITKFLGIPECKKKYPILANIIYYVVMLITDFFLNEYTVLSTVILFIVSLSYALIISGFKWIKSIIAACVYKVSLIAISSFVISVILVRGGDVNDVWIGSENYIRFLAMLIQKVSLFAVLTFVLNFLHRDEYYENNNGIFAFVIFLITVVGLGAVVRIMLNSQGEYRIGLLIISSAFLLIDIIMYVLLGYVIRLQKNKYEVKMLNDKIKFEESKYNETINIWNQVRKIRHELRNKMTVISGLLEEKEYNKCLEYANESLYEISKTGKFIQTGNTVLDYLINSRLMVLQDAQIDISGSIGNLDDIKESDLASLVGNIIDNAIEAITSLEEKHIELLFGIQDGYRMIICKNNISKSVLKDNKQLATTKTDVLSHGFGHQIVKEIAEKYHGFVTYFEETDMFGVQIMLPLMNNVNM